MTKVKLEYKLDKAALAIVKVPHDTRECTVCGHWKPYKEFCNDKGQMVRTNCEACYNMPYNEMRALADTTYQATKQHQVEIYHLMEQLRVGQQLMTKKAFLKQITDQLKGIGDDELIHAVYDTYDPDGYSYDKPMDDLSIDTKRKTIELDVPTQIVEVKFC